MADFEIITAPNFKNMPWKNGLGSTLEIKRYDDENGQRFRISKASVVEDGLFSDFNGQDRTLVLLSGEGMTLEHKGQNNSSSHTLKNSLDIARFSGADETYATLKNNTPIEDLNIMVRAKDTRTNVTAIDAKNALKPSNSTSILFNAFYANNDCRLSISNETNGEEIIRIEEGNFLYFKAPHSLINSTITQTEGNGVFIEIFDNQ